MQLRYVCAYLCTKGYDDDESMNKNGVKWVTMENWRITYETISRSFNENKRLTGESQRRSTKEVSVGGPPSSRHDGDVH